MAGHRRRDAPGDLERHLLHRPGEVHRVRRLLRPRGVRRRVPRRLLRARPDSPETEDVLLARARVLHPDKTIPDDAPSRFTQGRRGRATPSASAAPAAARAGAGRPSRLRWRRLRVEAEVPGLAIPAPEEWEVPIRCFRCEGEYDRALSGPTAPAPCSGVRTASGSLVPTLSMVRAVGDALERFHGEWTATFERFHAKRQRELEQFEERQRRALERVRRPSCKTVAEREKAPGAPTEASRASSPSDAGRAAAAARVPGANGRTARTAEELLDLVFTARGRDPEFGPRFLDDAARRRPALHVRRPTTRRWRAPRARRRCAVRWPRRPSSSSTSRRRAKRPIGGGITEIGAVRVERRTRSPGRSARWSIPGGRIRRSSSR